MSEEEEEEEGASLAVKRWTFAVEGGDGRGLFFFFLYGLNVSGLAVVERSAVASVRAEWRKVWRDGRCTCGREEEEEEESGSAD